MIRTLTVALAVAGISLASPSWAEEMGETIEFEKLSHEQRTTISNAGVAAMQGIADARRSLERKDGGAARQALGKAAAELRSIRQASPSANLADGVSDLHDQLVEGEGGNPEDLAPLYTRLDAYQAIAGVGAAEEVRSSLDGAKGSLAAGNPEEAAVLLESVRDTIRYVEIDVPVKETLARVDRSITQIGNDDYLGAQANLRESLGSLQTFGDMASIQMDSEMQMGAEAVGTGPPE